MKRRQFLKSGLAATATAFAAGAPLYIPSGLFGGQAPSNTITMGAIGLGRMGMDDLRGFLELDDVRVLAVCDVDRHRAEKAARVVNERYSEGSSGKHAGCDVYEDFREILARRDMDAVMICTPDHWHGIQAIMAAEAGKDIFVEKPMTYSIHEGRVLSNTVHRYGRILQVGSQQRSDAEFRFACELVRNGRIGKLHTIRVGFAQDPFGGNPAPMPVPENLNYDLWLGPAPEKPYTEERVHPRDSYERPGWMRISDYCLGMITGWGSHHMDIAHWGMGMEESGPVSVEGWGEFSEDGLWDVHGAFRLEYGYDNGVRLICADSKQNDQGVRFEGSDGWVYVRRGFIDASPKTLLQEHIGPGEIQLYRSNHHKKNFVECMRSRNETVAPVEHGHRSASACILGYAAMVSGRKINWSPEREACIDDDQAARLLNRPMRFPWRV